MNRRCLKRILPSILVLFVASTATAWGGRGHRMVTYLALDRMQQQVGNDCPKWLFAVTYRDRVAYQSVEADRYRAVRTNTMSHENNPEHYIDLEMLSGYGLTLHTLPRLRRQFEATIIEAHTTHPLSFERYDAEQDPTMVSMWPGFVPYAVMEHYTKLRASFRLVRLLEEHGDDEKRRVAELEQARANVVYHMGMLSHYVADTAQPLHTTIHHHGWVGENPQGYTTESGFHALIDSGVLDALDISYESLKERRSALTYEVAGEEPWEAIVAHLSRSFEKLETLYTYERDGILEQEAGRALIEERLLDGAGILGALYSAAWKQSELSKKDIEDYKRYEP